MYLSCFSHTKMCFGHTAWVYGITVPWSGIKPTPPAMKGWILTTGPPERKKVKLLSHVRLFATPWTVDLQAPLSMGFSRQECWSGLPFPSPGDLPDPGIEHGSPALQADALPSKPPGKHNLWQRRWKYTMEKRQSLQPVCWNKLDELHIFVSLSLTHTETYLSLIQGCQIKYRL